MRNLKNILSVVLFFILTSSLQAQHDALKVEERKSELTQEELAEAKLKFIAMLDSSTWKEADGISKLFAKNFVGCTSPSLGDSSFIPWMKENLHLSEFESLEEAIALRNAYKEASAKITEENLSLYQLMAKASYEQIIEITQPFVERTKKYFFEERER